MTHDHAEMPDLENMFTAEYWDDRYGTKPSIWSGNPNVRLVEGVAGLPPGVALDVGSGEGVDAIWLATRGWQVTGVDVSTVALTRAAERAAGVGAEVADRITWQQVDILSWRPEPDRFDLVSAQYMHLPQPTRDEVFTALASSVRAGGTLLIVGHHPSDLQTSVGRPDLPDLFYTGEQVGAILDPAGWRLDVVGAPGRPFVDPDGQPITIHDAVLQATRLR